jgi:hypothetical protein
VYRTTDCCGGTLDTFAISLDKRLTGRCVAAPAAGCSSQPAGRPARAHLATRTALAPRPRPAPKPPRRALEVVRYFALYDVDGSLIRNGALQSAMVSLASASELPTALGTAQGQGGQRGPACPASLRTSLQGGPGPGRLQLSWRGAAAGDRLRHRVPAVQEGSGRACWQ